MSKGIWDSLNEKVNKETSEEESKKTIKQVKLQTSQQPNKETSEEKVKRTYKLPVSTISKLYELKSKFPLEDIENMVNKAIIEYHKKHIRD